MRLGWLLRKSSVLWRWREPWRWVVGLLVAATIWGLVDVRRRGCPNFHDHRTDLTVYTEAGAAFFDGRSPYAVANPRGWTYLYPPLFAMLLAPLHALPTQDQVTVWFFVNLLICWGCYCECRRLWRMTRADDEHQTPAWIRSFPWLAVAAALVATLPTLNCLQRGQVGLVKFYLLLLGFRLLIGGSTYRAWIAGGIVLSLPIVLKIVPVLPVALVVFMQFSAWMERRRKRPSDASWWARRCAASTTGVALGLLLFFLILPAALVGWKANLRHLDTWAQFMLTKADDGGVDPRSGNSRSVRNQSLQNATYRLGNFVSHVLDGSPDDRLVEQFGAPPMAMDSRWSERAIFAARLSLLLALLATGARLGRATDGRLEQMVGFALGCAAMLVVSPVARGHYFMLLSPGVLFLPLWLARHDMQRAAVIMAVVPVVLVGMHYAMLWQVGRIGLLGLGTFGWLMAAMVLVACTYRPTTTEVAGRVTADMYSLAHLAKTA